jgi:hypothetical protein
MELKFEEKIAEILSEKTDMGKYSDQTFSLGPSEISEIIADADIRGKLSPEEYDSLEDDLTKAMDRTFKKFKGSMDGAEYFWALAKKAGKAYGLTIKQ